MCSGSEVGWYLRLIDFVYHSTLGLRVIKKQRRFDPSVLRADRSLNPNPSIRYDKLDSLQRQLGLPTLTVRAT